MRALILPGPLLSMFALFYSVPLICNKVKSMFQFLSEKVFNLIDFGVIIAFIIRETV